jgi:ATP-dependent protease ClpP protease subunit
MHCPLQNGLKTRFAHITAQEGTMGTKIGTRVLDDADFTPNPDRAIWVEGQLNEALLDRLRPRILELTAQSREPITVFINSAGGLTGEAILRLLKKTTHDGARPARIITVAAPKAKSGAANLLSAGDFAIASPQSMLLYHGARWKRPGQDFTGECVTMARVLPTLHEIAAAALAGSSIRRFRSIFNAERPLFAQHRAERAENGEPNLTDLECFEDLLCGKLSPAARTVLELAIALRNSYSGLALQFHRRLRRGRTVTKAQLQKLMLYASIAFEHESGEGGGPDFDGGLSRISDHFYFLNAYFDVERLCAWVAGPAESRTDDADVDEVDFRVFFLALCRALQEGENHITPADALWLGLIDTIRDEPASPESW